MKNRWNVTLFQKLSGRFAWTHRPSERGGAGPGAIAVPKQQVQLMPITADAARGVGLRPVPKAALRESLLSEPETLVVVGENFDSVTSQRTEYKQRTAQRLAGQHTPAERGQAIDAFPEIDELDRHENPHLRRDLNHRLCRRNRFTNARSSPDPAAPRCTMSRAPPGWTHSTTPRSPPPDRAPRECAAPAPGSPAKSANAG